MFKRHQRYWNDSEEFGICVIYYKCFYSNGNYKWQRELPSTSNSPNLLGSQYIRHSMDFLDISVELFIVFIIVCIILCLHGIGINSTFGNQLQVSANLFISPLPVKPGGGL